MTATLGKILLKVFVVLSFCFFSMAQSHGQIIRINVEEKPLYEVLVELNQNYGIQFSMDHRIGTGCLITESTGFQNAEAAIQELIGRCNLRYEIIEGVFIINKKPKENYKKPRPVTHTYSGQLIDAFNTEPLPYSNLVLNETNLIADANGNFSFITGNENERLKVSYVGYYQLDTIITKGNNQQIKLTPSIIGLNEVIVTSDANVMNAVTGEKSGLIKINQQVASFLPGNRNNTLFNMLRLHPGILAASEQTGDYSFWGSYRGHNLVLFDGITLFSASSLNNEIGVVNPLMVKDIEVLKGGYDVDQGDRVGGIVKMTGLFGSDKDYIAKLNVNSQTVNGYLNVPVAHRIAVQAAVRQSYYQLLDWRQILTKVSDDKGNAYYPENAFRDANFKVSSRTKSGDDIMISLIGANESSAVKAFNNNGNEEIPWERSIEKQQWGGSINYSRNWNRAGRTLLKTAYTSLKSNSFDRKANIENQGQGQNNKRSYFRYNSIRELSFKVDHQLPTVGSHSLKAGVSATGNAGSFIEDIVKILNADQIKLAPRYSLYIKDLITIGEHIDIQPGVKFDYIPVLKQQYLQPRMDANISLNQKWRINLAWGLYNQYISEVAVYDDLQNVHYFWDVVDTPDSRVLQGMHSVLGLAYKFNGLEFSSEGFYKTTDNLSRLNIDPKTRNLRIRYGNARSYGIDFYIKKELNQHDLWISYTISRTEESFPEYGQKEYLRAIHDQTHEVKAAGIFNLKPWYFSVNYIFGSGLVNSLRTPEDKIIPYNRLDAALLYRFNTKSFNLESGLSIVNVLNTRNLGYSGFSNLLDGRKLYARSIPFTPSIFLTISF